METKDEILTFIISEIRSFLDSGKNGASLGKLSSRTGIPKTTISRYAQNEVTSAPTPDISFSFLSFFKGPSDAAKLMRIPYEKWWEHTGKFIGDNVKVPSTDSCFEFTPIHAKIMAKSELPGGVSNKWIIENYGTQIGLPSKNDLLRLEILIERNGVNYACTEKLIESNRYSLLSMIKAELENFPIETAGQNALLWHLSEPVTETTRKQINELIKKLVQDVREIRENSRNCSEPKNVLLKLNMFGDWAEEPEQL